MSKKNIVVTGSSGFVGQYLFNNYSEKYKLQSFSFLRDKLDDLDLKSIDTVIHLAALVHQMNGADTQEYMRVNYKQTIDLAKKAKQSGVRHFIFMSTIKVYGEETEIAYKEDTQCQPSDDYGVSKLKAELALNKLIDENFIVSIIRTPIVYGKGVKANIKSLISLINKVPILPFYNTNNKRSMVYIGNLCHLIDVLIQKTPKGIFLASDDNPLSTSELIKIIAKALNKKVFLIPFPFFKFVLRTLKPSFYKRLYGSLEVDNTYTKKVLDYQNIYSIEDGILEMINNK